jgi:ribosomal protein S27AE
MPDVTSVIATIAAIKHSIDVVKAVKDADYDLDKSILKEKIAVLVDSLLEAKIQANETLDLIQEKDKKIAELITLLAFKEKIIFKKGVYYKTDGNGSYESEPYCSRCWDYEQKAVHLFERGKDYFECPQCKYTFGISQGIYL